MTARSTLVFIVAAASCQRTDTASREKPAKPVVAVVDAAQGTRALPPLPDRLPGARVDISAAIGSATRVAIGDLDGDGRAEMVVVDANRLRVLDATGRERVSAPVTRGAQQLVIADLDGDKRGDVVVGWGVTREHLDTKVAFSLFRLADGALTEQAIVAPETSRQDVAAIVPRGDSLLLAYFDSKYSVTSVTAKRGNGWELTTIGSLRMATSFGRGDVDGDGIDDLVVGRVYGDAKDADGDAFVWRPDGSRTPIPTTRGLRSLLVVDDDGDGRSDVFLGDGWHQNYGQNARGLLSRSTFHDGQFTTSLIEDTAGQYAIEKILAARLGGKLAIVTMGSHYIRVFSRVNDAWHGVTIAGAARDIAVGQLDDVDGDEIVVIGERSEIVSLRDAM